MKKFSPLEKTEEKTRQSFRKFQHKNKSSVCEKNREKKFCRKFEIVDCRLDGFVSISLIHLYVFCFVFSFCVSRVPKSMDIKNSRKFSISPAQNFPPEFTEFLTLFLYLCPFNPFSFSCAHFQSQKLSHKEGEKRSVESLIKFHSLQLKLTFFSLVFGSADTFCVVFMENGNKF